MEEQTKKKSQIMVTKMVSYKGDSKSTNRGINFISTILNQSPPKIQHFIPKKVIPKNSIRNDKKGRSHSYFNFGSEKENDYYQIPNLQPHVPTVKLVYFFEVIQSKDKSLRNFRPKDFNEKLDFENIALNLQNLAKNEREAKKVNVEKKSKGNLGILTARVDNIPLSSLHPEPIYAKAIPLNHICESQPTERKGRSISIRKFSSSLKEIREKSKVITGINLEIER